MTQLEALSAAKELLPEIADLITVDRRHQVGMKYGHMDEFVIWSHEHDAANMLAHSLHSWEHALAMLAPVKIANTQPADTSRIDEEVSA